MNVFDEALKSLDEAIEYEQGNSSKGREAVRILKPVTPLREYTGEDIKRIREAYNYTQSYFGALLGVSMKSVQSWEYNQSKPNGAARRIISIVEKGEGFLQEAEIISG
ncbi:MAG: helix-turn-helix domain-containing protein [Defluviitaleaceae bacterium]|nr:helix-turn-helix domain-containing protein [Defluviitaleaceae bacterium]